jgi:hypothetical protein
MNHGDTSHEGKNYYFSKVSTLVESKIFSHTPMYRYASTNSLQANTMDFPVLGTGVHSP